MPTNASHHEGRMAEKVAIVTGGASGFGRAISNTLAREGCKVVVGDLNREGLDATIAEIRGAGGTGSGVRMDVTSESDWASIVEKTISEFGRLDCVVNNAGWSYANKASLGVTEDDFDRCFSINVKSVFWSVGAAVPHLKSRGGSIINISSIGCHRPRPGLVWYNASKAAVSNATKGLAAEFGPDNIRVNAICPLLSATGLFEAFAGIPYAEDNIAKFTAQLNVANAVLFLASEEGKFCTGVLLDVDGGKSI